jgi:hypothetical protein
MPEEITLVVPRRVAPSKKLTVPRGFPVGVGETVAVNTTDCPVVAGLGLAPRVVVVDAGPTAEITAVTGEEVEVAKAVFPE